MLTCKQSCRGRTPMKCTSILLRHWALAAAIVVLAGLTWLLALHPVAAAPPVGETAYRGPEACANCHPKEYAEWKTAPHAQTGTSERFRQMWAAEGYQSECLRCHSTGYDQATGKSVMRGVSCEACHGPYQAGHPAAQMSMKLVAGSEMCQGCHEKTYQEWQASPHSQKDIQCAGCHQAHRAGLRISDDTQLCGACHTNSASVFTRATHRARGLNCVSCHMAAPGPEAKATHGNSAVDHSFRDSTQTCLTCHAAAIHSSDRLVTIRQQMDEFQTVTLRRSTDELPALEAEIAALKQEAEEARKFAILVLGLSLGVGGFGGLIMAAILTSSRRREQE